ncbi:MAG: PQQ-dependent sugar dehydrogenase [Deinococcales bacterium]
MRALRINRAVLAVAATGALLCQLGAAFGERLQVAARGLRAPVTVAAAGDGRLYVVEQAGTVRIVVAGQVSSAPFLDIRELVGSGGERGLLGLAFDPDYASSGTFYVDYTDVQGYSVLARYTRASDDRADPASAEILMRVRQPYSNHNGGELRFGPDGYLYWGLGDGGSGGDPHGNGQDPGTLLGAILRLDVSGPAATAAPGNPFVGTAGARPEVWVYGLRNPWRFSFDAGSGDLYIGDVGQNAIEEIDLVAAGTAGGANFGWNVMEGNRCYRPAQLRRLRQWQGVGRPSRRPRRLAGRAAARDRLQRLDLRSGRQRRALPRRLWRRGVVRARALTGHDGWLSWAA